MADTDLQSALVYGSCVSRDLVTFANGRARTLEYVARQSWISAFSKPSTTPDTQMLTSPFQIRSLESDWESSASKSLTSRARQADVVLLDLVDERDGVYEVNPGEFITNSGELRRSGWVRELRHLRPIPLGSSEHFDLWSDAAQEMRRLLVAGGLEQRTTVLGTPFTDNSVEGDMVPQHAGKSADEWNSLYQPYVAVLEELDFRVLMLPSEYCVSTRQHRWSIAPYHYVDGAYRWWLDQIIPAA